jgi:two-component system response regulator WspF
VRIAIVNDMAMAVEVLRRAVTSVPGYEIVWTAINGAQAVTMCAQDRPDLVLMDLVMPVMDGVEATRRIMRTSPCPILIVTAGIETHTPQIFEALAAGALDVTRTPEGSSQGSRDLLHKLHMLSEAMNGSPPVVARAATLPAPRHEGMPLVGIGASAGGPAALAEVLSSIPARTPAAIVIVQHIDSRFAEGLAAWLRTQTAVDVRIARAGERPAAGAALLAATDDHLVLLGDRTLAYVSEPCAAFYRPSVDVWFESASRIWPGPLVAVLLTGMGRDGARGLLAVQQAGGLTIAQDQASSVVYGMPKAAAEAGAADEILPLRAIGPRILAAVSAPAAGTGRKR